jgi:hypothetical protein
MRYLATMAAAFVLAAPAFGHHSDAQLDMNTVTTFKGKVTEFYLRNPHAYFTVETKDERGQPVEWTVQMASGLTLARRGWTPESLAVGEEVTVGLHPARDGKPYGLMESVEKANGVALPSVGGYGQSRGATAVARATSVEGIWLVDRDSRGPDYPGGLDQLMHRDLVLTEKGKAAEAAFKIEDDPLLQCIGRPTPGDIVYTDLYPLEIKLNDDKTATIRSQFFDEHRTVYMDGRAHPPATERFHEGHSIGHWEGDTLIVDTTNFADHRSRLTDNGTRLSVEFTLEDPEFIARPMTHSRKLIYTPDADMSPFNCDIESTQRYIREQ